MQNDQNNNKDKQQVTKADEAPALHNQVERCKEVGWTQCMNSETLFITAIFPRLSPALSSVPLLLCMSLRVIDEALVFVWQFGLQLKCRRRGAISFAVLSPKGLRYICVVQYDSFLFSVICSYSAICYHPVLCILTEILVTFFIQ